MKDSSLGEHCSVWLLLPKCFQSFPTGLLKNECFIIIIIIFCHELLLLLSVFNWSIIALQCCIRVCFTVKLISCTCACIPALLPLPSPQPHRRVPTEPPASSLCCAAGFHQLFTQGRVKNRRRQ